MAIMLNVTIMLHGGKAQDFFNNFEAPPSQDFTEPLREPAPDLG
jgi:hypothetical protein